MSIVYFTRVKLLETTAKFRKQTMERSIQRLKEQGQVEWDHTTTVLMNLPEFQTAYLTKHPRELPGVIPLHYQIDWVDVPEAGLSRVDWVIALDSESLLPDRVLNVFKQSW